MRSQSFAPRQEAASALLCAELEGECTKVEVVREKVIDLVADCWDRLDHQDVIQRGCDRCNTRRQDRLVVNNDVFVDGFTDCSRGREEV